MSSFRIGCFDIVWMRYGLLGHKVMAPLVKKQFYEHENQKLWPPNRKELTWNKWTSCKVAGNRPWCGRWPDITCSRWCLSPARPECLPAARNQTSHATATAPANIIQSEFTKAHARRQSLLSDPLYKLFEFQWLASRQQRLCRSLPPHAWDWFAANEELVRRPVRQKGKSDWAQKSYTDCRTKETQWISNKLIPFFQNSS